MDIFGVLTWLVEKILQTIDFRTRVSVLVHEAYIERDLEGTPKFFIKVTNLSKSRDITVTHVWVGDEGGGVDILNVMRPLPKTLRPTEQWETWVEKKSVGGIGNIFSKIMVKLSNGKIIPSSQNKNVRPRGYVA